MKGLFAFGDHRWPGLAKLNEECGEIVQIIGKLMMTHGDPNHWSGDLRRKLVEEMADVTAAIGFVGVHCLSDEERDFLLERSLAKYDLFETWRREQRAEGVGVLTEQGGRV